MTVTDYIFTLFIFILYPIVNRWLKDKQESDIFTHNKELNERWISSRSEMETRWANLLVAFTDLKVDVNEKLSRIKQPEPVAEPMHQPMHQPVRQPAVKSQPVAESASEPVTESDPKSEPEITAANAPQPKSLPKLKYKFNPEVRVPPKPIEDALEEKVDELVVEPTIEETLTTNKAPVSRADYEYELKKRGLYLMTLRSSERLTQGQLGELAELPQAEVSRYERAARPITPWHAKTFSQIFNVNYQNFLVEQPVEPNSFK